MLFKAICTSLKLRSIQIPQRPSDPVPKDQIAAHHAGLVAPILKSSLPFAKPFMRPRAGNGAKSRVVPKMRSGPWTKFRTVQRRRFGTLSKSRSKPKRTKSGSRIGGVNRLTVPRMRTRTESDSGFNSGTVPKLRKGNKVNSQQHSQTQSGFLASDSINSIMRMENPPNPLSDLGAINSYICNELQGKFQEIFGQLELECGPSARNKDKGGTGYQLGSSGARKTLEHNHDFERMDFQQIVMRELLEHLLDY